MAVLTLVVAGFLHLVEPALVAGAVWEIPGRPLGHRGGVFGRKATATFGNAFHAGANFHNRSLEKVRLLV
jgi:hypothetical protein